MQNAYGFGKTVELGFDAAVDRVSAELAKEGFGILTEIDVKATMKKKLDIDFRPYTILGACNPEFAHKALQSEDMIGTMLPCNVVVRDAGSGNTEVAAIDPVASMQAIDNPELKRAAVNVRGKLQKVVDGL